MTACWMCSGSGTVRDVRPGWLTTEVKPCPVCRPDEAEPPAGEILKHWNRRAKEVWPGEEQP